MANLQPRERVLDLGIGSRSGLAASKIAVENGLCVGVDTIPEFLKVDVLAPAGANNMKIYLIKGNMTDGALPKTIWDCTGVPAKQPLYFNVIFLLNVFNTIPPAQRQQTLQGLKGMLVENGCIIRSVSARFGTPNNAQGIVQFSSNNLTEAPADRPHHPRHEC